MTDRAAKIAELTKQRAEIDGQLRTIKQEMKDEIKAAFAVAKKPKKPKQIKMELVK